MKIYCDEEEDEPEAHGDTTNDSVENRLRIIPIYDIQRGLANFVMEKMGEYALANPYKSINIVFRSYGGSVDESIAIADAIEFGRGLLKGDAKVVGIVHSYNASAGPFVLQFCDVRKATEHSQIMIHGMFGGAMGDQRTVDALNINRDNYLNVYANVFASRTKKDLKYWKKTLKDSTPQYLTAKQALDWGIIDEVVPVILPGVTT